MLAGKPHHEVKKRVEVRHRGLKKNMQRLVVLFALSNLWMVRGKLMQLQGSGESVRVKTGKST